MTNSGNNYKFRALCARRANKDSVMVQRLKKDGTWGKASENKRFGNETDAQVVERLNKLNPGSTYRLAE